ncbi:MULTISPECIES: restriction endonuclease subunit S [Serratia]|uniref:restriction endonuclease subunit S n=1 Tax=Serratia TaxID=613 RepID=UPI0011F182C4|nr:MULTISPECIES: restriction endonuclease subunit S [Serratia]NRN14290.1 4'-phosphopantetheinyl transferase [Serratia marcescens]NRN37609.1 4'-phosphopantetheinyl transferase [Serratia marcescens]
MSGGKLPEGWINTTIGDISVRCSQRVPDENEQFIYVDIGSINRELKVIENPQYLIGKDAPSRARKEIKAHDIIVSLTRPNLNAVALVSEKYDEQIASTGFEVIRPTLVESRYIFALVRSRHFIDTISGLVQGALYPAAKSSDVQSYEFPLPPLAEQKIISEKLDTLLAQVDSTKARLEQIPQILKRFRQAVLAAVVDGKSVNTNTDENTLTTLGNIAKNIKYGTSKKCSETQGSTAVLRIPNIGPGYIINNNLKYADFDQKELVTLTLREGDLLLIRSNGSVDLVGKVAVISENDTEYLYAGYLIRVRLLQEKVVSKYVSYCLQSPQLRQVIENIARSTSGVNNINSKELASLKIPLPPLQEQHEIVRRVEQLFAYADSIEKQVNNALTHVNNLTQSILSKAFRGELTAQWRAENPDLISGENSAAALLEKIKAERAGSRGKKNSRKKA